MTKYCHSCHISNRDNARYCRGCAGKFSGRDSRDGGFESTFRDSSAELPTSMRLDLAPPKSVAATRARLALPRRIGRIPVPHGVDVSIMWLVIVLASMQGAFILWYLNRQSPRGVTVAQHAVLSKPPMTGTATASAPAAARIASVSHPVAPPTAPAAVLLGEPSPPTGLPQTPLPLESRSSRSLAPTPAAVAQDGPDARRGAEAAQKPLRRAGSRPRFLPRAEEPIPSGPGAVRVYSAASTNMPRTSQPRRAYSMDADVRSEVARREPGAAPQPLPLAGPPRGKDARPRSVSTELSSKARQTPFGAGGPCDAYNPYGEIPCTNMPRARVERAPAGGGVAASINGAIASIVSGLAASKGHSGAASIAAAAVGNSADPGGSGSGSSVAGASGDAGGGTGGGGGGPGR